MKSGRAMFLAYDQGLEHGPSSDFNDKNVDPLYILEIARKGKFNAVVFQKGIAEKYQKEIKKSKVPLIVKLNGKTALVGGEPISRQICSVKEAIELGASAVGYTVYIGSEHESEMMQEFDKIEEEAHAKGIPIIAWIYPRGKSIKDDSTRVMMAYATRVGLEIGADIVKIRYNGNLDDLKWAVKAAGRCKVVVAGGLKVEDDKFVENAKEVMKTGISGLAIGRNVWQSDKPLNLAKEINKSVMKK